VGKKWGDVHVSASSRKARGDNLIAETSSTKRGGGEGINVLRNAGEAGFHMR